MKSFIKSFAALCAVYFLATGFAVAEPAEVLVDANGCAFLHELYTLPLSNIPSELDVIVSDQHKISVNNENGNVNFTCSQDVEPTTTGRAVVFNFDNTGLTCKVGSERSEDWHQVISRRGKAKLVCHYHE